MLSFLARSAMRPALRSTVLARGPAAAVRPLFARSMAVLCPRDAPADLSGGQPNLKYLVLGGSPHEEDVC